MLFNEKLKMLRKKENLTQEELAEKLNVSRQAITKWESGDGTPDIYNLKQISTLFNITIDELIKEEKEVIVEDKNEHGYVEELEIDHTKHFDIHMKEVCELNIMPNTKEIVRIELMSNEEKLDQPLKIKFDDSYNKLDIDIKNKKQIETINMYLPEKYINDIELNAKIKTLNITNLNIEKLEYDGTLKYLNIKNSKGAIILNTTKCDIEANYDKLDGKLEINTINSVSRITLPKDNKYKTILKGRKNEFIDATDTENSKNTIELNGINSKLIVIEY